MLGEELREFLCVCMYVYLCSQVTEGHASSLMSSRCGAHCAGLGVQRPPQATGTLLEPWARPPEGTTVTPKCEHPSPESPRRVHKAGNYFHPEDSVCLSQS